MLYINITPASSLKPKQSGSIIELDHGLHYAMRVRKLSPKRTITDLALTVAHECVHIRQFVANDLSYITKHTDWQSIPYQERWWEVEARALERELVQKFVAFIDPTVDIPQSYDMMAA